MKPDDLIRARYGALPFTPPEAIPPALAALLLACPRLPIRAETEASVTTRPGLRRRTMGMTTGCSTL